MTLDGALVGIPLLAAVDLDNRINVFLAKSG
jgi:hypothetical protein